MVPFVPAPGHCSGQLVQPLRSCLRVMTTAWRPDQRPGAPQGIGAACSACCSKSEPVCPASGRSLKVPKRWRARRCAVPRGKAGLDSSGGSKLGGGACLGLLSAPWKATPVRPLVRRGALPASTTSHTEDAYAVVAQFERSLRVCGSGGVFSGGAARLWCYSSAPARDVHAPPCPSSSRQS